MSQEILHYGSVAGSSDIETITYTDVSKQDVDAYVKNLSKYVRDAINFNAGAILCQRYLYGSIGLDKFCAEMIEEDLKSYLFEIPHMPSGLVTKYGLTPEEEEEEEEEGVDCTNDGGYGNTEELKNIVIN